MEIEFSIDQIPDGEYLMFIQVHLKEALNDTYVGKVNVLSGKEMHVQLKPFETKGTKNREQKRILSDIEVTIN